MEKQKSPEIRFNQFNENWSITSLGDLMNVGSVKRVHQADWCDTGVRFLRARDIVAFAKNEDIADPIYISPERYEEYSKLSGTVKVGDLLVTGVGTIGVPMLVKNDDPLYFKDGNVIWFKNENVINGLFLYYSFINKTTQNFIKDSAGIGTVGTYTITNGKRTPIYLPKENEQIQVGNFFQNLDQSIALHEKKLSQTQNLKKAMLEKMFPTAESNKQPEIRLKGFSGEWEEFQLENLGEFKNGMNMDKDSMGFGNPFVNIQHIFESSEVTKHNLELVNATNKQKKDYNLLKGDVLFVRSSVKLEGVGDTAVLVDDIEGATYSGFLIRFRSNINLSLDYKKVMFSIPLVRKQILANATTSANTNINQESLKKILILLPKYEEQTQIGLFFKQLDETLVLQQQKLQTLKNLKQAFLEKMFV